MQQVLFYLPIPNPWNDQGLPIYGFGIMLFITFVTCAILGSRWAKYANMPRERIQDLAIVVFVFGIIGARLVYLWQFQRPLSEFFEIWNGGIVFYGSAIGGWIGYWVYYWFVLRKIGVATWKLADVIAPLIVLGLALGRIGCFLNGCCYGQPACPECVQVEFPLLTSPARDRLVGKGSNDYACQTSVGFSIQRRGTDNPLTLVDLIEPHSNAAKSGLKKGDRIIEVNGQPNSAIVEITGTETLLKAATETLKVHSLELKPRESLARDVTSSTIRINDLQQYRLLYPQLFQLVNLHGGHLYTSDHFSTLIQDWPRGEHELQLTVDRNGEKVALAAFTPRSVGLHPTQVYETISMVLLFFLLLAFYPFRRHDGQVFVVMMVAYATHRFFNEQLRNEPVEHFQGTAYQMTLSQLISIIMLLCAAILEMWLRFISPPPAKSGPQTPSILSTNPT